MLQLLGRFFFSVVYRAMNGLCGEVHLASATLLFDSVRSGRRTKDFQKKKIIEKL